MDIVNDPQQGSDPALAKQPSTAEVGEVPTMDLERTLPRQISTGNQRGTQNITGEQTVSESVNGTPVITLSGTNQNQVFHNPDTDTDVITIGRYSDKTYNLRIQDLNGVGIAQFGNFTDGSTALKIAPPGVEVATATDAQLIFNSGQNVFKIVKTLSAPFSLTSGAVNPVTTTVTIDHDLNYVRLILPTITVTTLTNGTPGIYPLPFFIAGTGGGTTNVFIMLSYMRVSAVTSKQVSFTLGIQAAAQTFEGVISCYVLQETAAPLASS